MFEGNASGTNLLQMLAGYGNQQAGPMGQTGQGWQPPSPIYPAAAPTQTAGNTGMGAAGMPAPAGPAPAQAGNGAANSAPYAGLFGGGNVSPFAAGNQAAQDRITAWDALKNNPGMAAAIAGLSMLGNNNGQRSFGQLVGRAGADALTGVGSAAAQQQALQRQDAMDKERGAFNALRMRGMQGDVQQQERMRALQARFANGDDSLEVMRGLYGKELLQQQWAREAEQRQMAHSMAMAKYQAGLRSPALTPFNDVNSLGKRWTTESADYLGAGKSLAALVDFANQKTGAGDLGMIFEYMKTLDPASVVREGEQLQARQTTAISNQLWGLYERVASGQSLTQTQRNNFIKAANARFKTLSETQAARNKQFAGLANAYNIDPARVYYDPYAGITDRVNTFLTDNAVPTPLPGNGVGGGVPGVSAPSPAAGQGGPNVVRYDNQGKRVN